MPNKLLIIIGLAMCLILAGCEPMPRTEVIKASKQCIDGGMDYTLVHSGWDYSVVAVHCQKPMGGGE